MLLSQKQRMKLQYTQQEQFQTKKYSKEDLDACWELRKESQFQFANYKSKGISAEDLLPILQNTERSIRSLIEKDCKEAYIWLSENLLNQLTITTGTIPEEEENARTEECLKYFRMAFEADLAPVNQVEDIASRLGSLNEYGFSKRHEIEQITGMPEMVWGDELWESFYPG